mgnify:CR=1 FL=1
MTRDHISGFASLKFEHVGLLLLNRVGQRHEDSIMTQAVHDASIDVHLSGGDVLLVLFVVNDKVLC